MARRGRYKDHLAQLGLKLVKPQRPIVKGRRESKAKVDQGLLAGSITAVHARELANHDMGFIHENQWIGRKVINEGGRWRTGLSA